MGCHFEKERRELLDAYLANPVDPYRLVRAQVALTQAIARHEANRHHLQTIKQAAATGDRVRVEGKER